MGVVDAVGDDSELEALALQVSAPMRGKPRELLAGLKYGVHQELVDLMMSDAPDDAYQQVKIWPR